MILVVPSIGKDGVSRDIIVSKSIISMMSAAINIVVMTICATTIQSQQL